MYKNTTNSNLTLTNLFSNTNISWYSSYDKALQLAQKEKKTYNAFIASSKDTKSNNILKEYF